jgi:DNA modification methylase
VTTREWGADAYKDWRNKLFYGDNLDVLRDRIAPESIDLVYLDPPFNSNRSYNVLFADRHGAARSQAQIQAFTDTWTWSTETEAVYQELIAGGLPGRAADALQAMHDLVGRNDVLAYLVMMSPRLVELHQVLKSTGSLYLHCDPTVSHYLKLLLDAIFGPKNFRNEIIWRRTGAHGKSQRFAPIHETILFFAKSADFKWNHPKKPYMRGHVSEYLVKDENGYRTDYYGNVLTGSGLRGGESGQPWRGFDPSAKGRHWAIPGAIVEEIDEDLTDLTQHQKMDRLFELGYIKIGEGQAWPIYEHYVDPKVGANVPDVWAYQPYTEGTVFGTEEGIDAEVRWLSPRDGERLNYQTQKPEGLLERIIAASSDPGDIVLDPFCGCGTTVAAAQQLGRRWIGIDITYIAIDLIRRRLEDRFDNAVFEIGGIPRDLGGAKDLAEKKPFDFERWAVSMIDGEPNEKQVGDRGIDGVVRFLIGSQYVKAKKVARAQKIGRKAASSQTIGRCLVSVKGGHQLNPGFVRDLAGTVDTEKAEMGVLITLDKPTPGMIDAANHAGIYEWPMNKQTFPKIQLVTVEELLNDRKPTMPPALTPYLAAVRSVPQSDQLILGGEASKVPVIPKGGTGPPHTSQ